MKQQLILAALLLTTLACVHLDAQTVGVLLKDSARMYDGYTLFAPQQATTTYLINRDGQVVHTWPGRYRTGHTVRLLSDGSIIRAGTPSVKDPLAAGGAGGSIDRFSWEGERTWSYLYFSDSGRQHHDLDIMPNGNVLFTAWYPVSRATALALGRIDTLLTDTTLWFERIIEVRPVGADSGEIVWTWDARQHLIQNADPTKANYGVLSEHPELLNINTGGKEKGWLHINAHAYNADRDEIIVSLHGIDEFIVIKKSTGAIVYRWGNPMNYGRGTIADQKLFGQHDTHWLKAGLPGAGHISVFNNGNGRPGGNATTLEELVPPLDASGNYVIEDGKPFGPTESVWQYKGQVGEVFYAPFISGWSRQPNGNAVVCMGPVGTFLEVTMGGDLVWKYANPVGLNGVVMQGQTPMNANVFKISRIPLDHPAFVGRTLAPMGKLEDGPLSVAEYADVEGIDINYAPGAERATITCTSPQRVQISAYDVLGRTLGVVLDGELENGIRSVDVPRGTLFLFAKARP